MIAVALGSTYLGGEKAKAVLALAEPNIFPTVVRVVITLDIPHGSRTSPSVLKCLWAMLATLWMVNCRPWILRMKMIRMF